MKKKIEVIALALFLTGCASSHLEFTDSSNLTINKHPLQISNENTMAEFPMNEDYLSPNYTGGYDLNFITKANFNKQYAAYHLIKDCINDIPLKGKQINFILADKVIVCSLDKEYRNWKPNYTFDSKGVVCIEIEDEWKTDQTLQPGKCWRNLIILGTKKRILCVDRVKLKGRYYAIVYVMQAEKKEYSFATLYHWNITQPELLPNTASSLAVFADITKKIIIVNQ